MKPNKHILMKKRLATAGQCASSVARAAGKAVASATEKAADAVGTAAKASARVYLAATFGNPAEKELSFGSHDPMRDMEKMRDAADDAATKRPNGGGSVPDAELARLFRTAGTAVWKMEQRMLDPESKEPRDEFRKVWRHVEAIKDALADIGVDIVDWTGKRYDEGMSLKVVAEEERPGTKQSDIIETLLPTIRFRKQIQLQQGEVIVGRPVHANSPEGGDSAVPFP